MRIHARIPAAYGSILRGEKEESWAGDTTAVTMKSFGLGLNTIPVGADGDLPSAGGGIVTVSGT